MDRIEFLGIDWLQEVIDDSTSAQSRDNIGEYLGWGDGWYQSTEYLEKLFDFLTVEVPLMDSEAPFVRNDGLTRPSLLDMLTESTSDTDRQAWMTAVETEAYWSVPANKEAYWSVPENRYGEPAPDDDYGMRYRYDKRAEVYEWEDPPDSGTWVSQAAADEIVLTREQQSAAQVSEQEAVAAEGQTAPDSEAASPGMDKLLDQLIQEVVLPVLPQSIDDVTAIAEELGTSEAGIMELLGSGEFVTEVIGEIMAELLPDQA